jgi:putative membrane protein
MASGIGTKALLIDLLPHWLVMTSASVFVLFSVFCFGAGVWRHLYPGPPPPVPDAARIHPAILVFVNSILGIVSVADFFSARWCGARLGASDIFLVSRNSRRWTNLESRDS